MQAPIGPYTSLLFGDINTEVSMIKKFSIELRFIYDIKFNHTVTFAGNRNAKFIHTKARQNTKQPTTTVRT